MKPLQELEVKDIFEIRDAIDILARYFDLRTLEDINKEIMELIKKSKEN